MSDKRAVVITGGGGGIGRTIAAGFAAAGDLVWSISRSGAAGPGVRGLAADVRDAPRLRVAVDAIRREHGSVDVWINNAGFGRKVPFAGGDEAAWEEVFDMNFRGAVNGSRAALAILKRPGGVIVNMASLAGLMAPSGHSAYATAKAAVIALTRSLAVEYAEAGIRVNAIAPGPVDTEGFRAAGGDPVARARSIPARRMVEPAEIAAACVFLAAPHASLTGHILVIDGASHAAGCYV